MADNRFDIMQWAGTDIGKAALAGALGGLVRWITLRSNWKEGLGAVIIGAICALYLGPLVAPLLEPVIGAIAPQGDPGGFSAFIVGLGGISITGLLIDAFMRRKGGDDKP